MDLLASSTLTSLNQQQSHVRNGIKLMVISEGHRSGISKATAEVVYPSGIVSISDRHASNTLPSAVRPWVSSRTLRAR